MKKVVLLLFATCGLSAMADLVSLHDLYESGAFNGETGIRKLESLLSKGCDPNERGFGGASLLMAVAEGKRRSDGSNDLAIAKVLLTHGADPNVADHVGNTLLMRLFGRKFDETKLELMKLLLERGADVKGGERRRSVLDQVGSWQVGTQKLEIVRMLVKRGAPVTDGAICSAWRDEPLRRYLLEQGGKTEDDFEVWSSGSSFSVRTKRKNGRSADLEQLHREMDERRIEREERHHQERMVHERMRRDVEDRILSDRRQDDEMREERDLKACQEQAERRRGEIVRGIPVENRQEFESWLASRRQEESAMLESARKRARQQEAELKSRMEKTVAHQAGVADEMRRNDEDQLRRLRESGAPEHMIQHIEMQNRMREMHQRHWDESEAIHSSGRFGFGQDSALVHELSEYRRWLDGRVREDESRADSFRCSIRGVHAERRTDQDALVRQIEENASNLRQIQDRQRRMSTIIVIGLAVAVVLVIVVVVSLWRRGRWGARDYGTCQHEPNVVANYFRCLRKYADFSGRADKMEYWTFALTNGLIGFLIRLAGAHGLGVAFAVVMLVPGLAAATRRLHDVGRSGWRLMLVLVPFVVVKVFGDMPMREVRELGWNEDLFTMTLTFSLCMLLVFGGWTLVLLLRKSAEDDFGDQDRRSDRNVGMKGGETVTMAAVKKTKQGLKAASDRRTMKKTS